LPKKVEPWNKRTEQLLVRLTADEAAWLDSASHLDRLSVNAYVYALIRAHVNVLQSNKHVRADRENRAAYEAAVAKTHRLETPTVDVSFKHLEIAEDFPSAQESPSD
jgi:uncharacterized protein (DUF1778 family)